MNRITVNQDEYQQACRMLWEANMALTNIVAGKLMSNQQVIENRKITSEISNFFKNSKVAK